MLGRTRSLKCLCQRRKGEMRPVSLLLNVRSSRGAETQSRRKEVAQNEVGGLGTHRRGRAARGGRVLSLDCGHCGLNRVPSRPSR